MRTIRIITTLCMVLITLQSVTLLMALRSYPISFWEMIPALLLMVGQVVILWRLWHLRRWAGILTLMVVAGAALYSLLWFPSSLPFLVVSAYIFWGLPRNWQDLKAGF
jgi:hypothetical protein